MANVTVERTEELRGVVAAPPSKSYTHRAVIAASLSAGESTLTNPLRSEDTIATVNACRALGVAIEEEETLLRIHGRIDLKAPRGEIDCGESASTIRFMMPVAALARGTTILTGREGLLRRPIGPLVEALRDLGVACNAVDGHPPVKVHGGGLEGGETSLPGDVSSQFVTGLLLACPLASRDTRIRLTSRLESRPYVALTLGVIRKHGIIVDASADYSEFKIYGRQGYSPYNHRVIGDFSSAAFLLAAAVVTNSHIRVENLEAKLKEQPDVEILNVLGRMGVELRVEENAVEVIGGRMRGLEIDVENTPDLVPVYAALGCFAEGETRIVNAGRLRIKESDRLEALAAELGKMGAAVTTTRDTLTVRGHCDLKGVRITPHNDHRIAMACAVAALGAKGETVITDGECVNKSYPNFFSDLKRLGGRVTYAS